MDILRQVWELLLGSVPTMLLFLLLLLCYTVILHRPLRRTLAERRERTAGAVERARAAIAIADAKAQEYEARLRAARAEILAAREKKNAGMLSAKDQTLAAAREMAQTRVRTARASLEVEAKRSRASLEGHVDELAEQILNTVLPAAARAGGGQ